MPEPRRVIFIGVPTARVRQLFVNRCPPEFQLDFDDDTSCERSAHRVNGADFVVVWGASAPAPVVTAAVGALLIQKVGEGVDSIDLAAARQLGIPVGRTSGVNAYACAELATSLMLAALRRIPEAHRSMAEGHWRKWDVRARTYELRGKQVGLVGLGKIGRLVAAQVGAFGASPVYYRRHRLAVADENCLGVRYLELDELLRTSDVISLHVPLTESTNGMIGHREFAAMKPNAILVNTARGAIVDADALYEALSRRRILRAALDVYDVEPLSADDRLRRLDNVLLTPHVGGVTDDTQVELVEHAVANMMLVAAGQPLPAADVVVDPTWAGVG